MSFDTRTGTRGRRQPGSGGPIGRWVTKRVSPDPSHGQGARPGL